MNPGKIAVFSALTIVRTAFLLTLVCGVILPAGAQTPETLYRASSGGAQDWSGDMTWSLDPSGSPTTNYQDNSHFVFTVDSTANTILANGSTQIAASITFDKSTSNIIETGATLILNGDITGTNEEFGAFQPSSSGVATLTLQVKSNVAYSGLLRNHPSLGHALNVTIDDQSTAPITLSSNNVSNLMTGIFEVNNAAGGGAIITGNMLSAATTRIREGGGRRVASNGTLGAIEAQAGAGGGGQLHIGSAFTAGTPGEDLNATSLMWSGGSSGTGAVLHFDLDTESDTSDLLALSGALTRDDVLGDEFVFDFNGADFTGVTEDRTYTLITFASGTDFSATGINLGGGSGSFDVTGTNVEFQYNAVPEPSSLAFLAFLALGAFGIIIFRRRCRRG